MNINYTPEQGKACLEIENAELRSLVNSCQEEIRRLKDRIDFYEDIESDRLAYIDELDKENQRLNNVLNELEKWLEDKQNLVCGCGITVDYIYAYENVLDYLSELKESDK